MNNPHKISNTEVEYNTFQLVKRILRQAKPYWAHIIGLFLLNLLASPIALLKPLALKLLIDSGFNSHPLPGFITFLFPPQFQFTFNAVVALAASLVIIVALIESIHAFVAGISETYTGEKLVLGFRTLVFNHMQRLSLAYHDSKGTSDSLYRLQWDTIAIRTLIMGNISPLVSASITLILMIIVMFLINWQFALIALCVIPPLVMLTKYSRSRIKKKWKKVKENESLALSIVHEVLNSLRVVKAFGQEDIEQERYANKSDIVVKEQLKVIKFGALFNFLVAMTFASATALFIYFGANAINAGTMTLGELTLVLAYLVQVFVPLQSIAKNLNSIQSSILSVERVFTLLDHEKEVKETPHSTSLAKAKGSFKFQHVSFSYHPDKLILNDLSFEIQQGDRVGIMGSTGAGKTTLINLLIRFYDPASGKILLDGIDVKSVKLKDYRNQFAMVLQEPVLFSSTIAENIRYGKPDASEKEIVEAAAAANAHNFIKKSKDGYDTLVGERGMQLSGGERQRISIARAFIKDAPVLILDEPTSSVDIKTESLIMEAMERLMEGRTTFMITHRLDTLNTCNVILHLENGRLIDVVRDHDKEFMLKKKLAFLTSNN